MHFRQWKRREFITLLGGAVAAWPFVAHAQRHTRSAFATGTFYPQQRFQPYAKSIRSRGAEKRKAQGRGLREMFHEQPIRQSLRSFCLPAEKRA